MAPSGNLIIVSGPSGSGKSALVGAVLKSLPGLRFSISYTTRAPRDGEEEGVHYFFVSQERFQDLIGAGEFLEWAQVYGNFYGTSRRFVQEVTAGGEDVVLDVDVQGARTIRAQRGDAISVFIMPPSFRELRGRLERRRLDKDYVIEQRLKIAGEEITQYPDYDFLIVNDRMEHSVEELEAIIIGSRCRTRCRDGAAKAIIATFGGLDAKDS